MNESRRADHTPTVNAAPEALARLAALEDRLTLLASAPLTARLTEADPDTPEERWDAAQVWAHIAEFIGYWDEQLRGVIRGYDGAPVPFGRTKTDAGRIRAIAMGRQRPIAQLATDSNTEIAALEDYLGKLDEPAWSARGLHPTRGVMDVAAIVQRFITDHLAEHADQLDGLAKTE